jgi:hypothetical protein
MLAIVLLLGIALNLFLGPVYKLNLIIGMCAWRKIVNIRLGGPCGFMPFLKRGMAVLFLVPSPLQWCRAQK